MNSKYKIILLVVPLLLLLSMGISFANYRVAMNSTELQLKKQSLPLSIDNIYTEIQKQIIEPYLVSSMMANDTFVLDWLQKDEHNTAAIEKYLESIKNKYGMLVSFLVSEKTHNYYTQDGYIETVVPTKETNKWYFAFKRSQKSSEINIDFNDKLANDLVMFINFKMFDEQFHYLGATGVGIEISYVQEMLKRFKVKYHLNVGFLDAKGNSIFQQAHMKKFTIPKRYYEQIFSKEPQSFEYQQDGSYFIVNTKYIRELDIYLIVKAKVDDFTQEAKHILYLSLTLSMALSLIIALILVRLIHNYNKKIEHLAEFDELTNLPNRKHFHRTFKYAFNLAQREHKPLALMFIDIDNFKNINDTLGHDVGDTVLQKFAKILETNIRKTDLIARWGGEEFVIAFVGADLNSAKELAEKIRIKVKNSSLFLHLLNEPLTISAGVIEVLENETFEAALTRADKAMYTSKTNGKNRVTAS